MKNWKDRLGTPITVQHVAILIGIVLAWTWIQDHYTLQNVRVVLEQQMRGRAVVTETTTPTSSTTTTTKADGAP